MKMIGTKSLHIAGGVGLLLAALTASSSQSWACVPVSAICTAVSSASKAAVQPVIKQKTTQMFNKLRTDANTKLYNDFNSYRNWLVTDFWRQHYLPAMMEMSKQMANAQATQSLAQGMFTDAQNQIDTQRLLQQMQANTVNALSPSPMLCTFGTQSRALAATEQKALVNQYVLSRRSMVRQLGAGDTLAAEGETKDLESRIGQFRDTYCNKNDIRDGLDVMCDSSPSARRNRDIDYVRSIGGRVSLDMDFTDTSVTDDEEDALALSANLYAHDVPGRLPPVKLESPENFDEVLNMRSVIAKRSVAQNSFNAIASLKAKGSGDEESFKYMRNVIKGLGISDEDTIKKLIGKQPSYFAQMEVLTKRIYQDPRFYTALMESPENVERQYAAMQSFELMQQRDLYNSMLRSEMLLSVLLELQVNKQQQRVDNEKRSLQGAGKVK